jgi:two-component system cell cycle sensor histidine kinase/response regulator CckA
MGLEDYKILVVDDEPIVVNVIRSALQTYGQTVLAASSGKEAIELFKEHHASIAMVVTDVTMPNMTGPELAEQLLELRPDLRILFISGYCDELPASMRAFGCVSKPFQVSQLVSRIHDLLKDRHETGEHRYRGEQQRESAQALSESPGD